MNWGRIITLAFFVFGGMLTTLIVISMRQDIDLVATDYYKQEIEYQKRIDQIDNFNKLTNKPTLQYVPDLNTCILSFPETMEVSDLSGTVHFFRPSGTKHDKIYSLGPGNRSFQFPTEDLIKGMWTVKVEWISTDGDYYFEQNLSL